MEVFKPLKLKFNPSIWGSANEKRFGFPAFAYLSILMKKLKIAALQTGITNLCIAGGVSANSGLRTAFQELCEKNQWKAFIPPFQYCTDNGAMIAITGYYKYLRKDFSSLEVSATARAIWQ